MTKNINHVGLRVVNLIRSVKKIDMVLPGDRITMKGEQPATYLGAIELEDDLQIYIQMHAFRLSDGLVIILQVSSLNRILGKMLY